MFKIGDRVRMVQSADTVGTVAGDLGVSSVDGGPRLPVRWDRSGMVTEWDPAFLRPADTDPKADPDEVVSHGFRRRRGGVRLDQFGSVLLIPGGFDRV